MAYGNLMMDDVIFWHYILTSNAAFTKLLVSSRIFQRACVWVDNQRINSPPFGTVSL